MIGSKKFLLESSLLFVFSPICFDVTRCRVVYTLCPNFKQQWQLEKLGLLIEVPAQPYHIKAKLCTLKMSQWLPLEHQTLIYYGWENGVKPNKDSADVFLIGAAFIMTRWPTVSRRFSQTLLDFTCYCVGTVL